jgi:hypothetical protein
MRKTDGRKINPTAMEEIRVRAVQRVQAGESPEVVIKTLGFVTACVQDSVVDALKNLLLPKSNGSIKQFVTKTLSSSSLNLHCGPVR